MRQRGAHRKGSELPPDDCDVRGPDDTHAAVDSPSHSRVSTMLGWLQQLLLLASLAVLCSSSFDIANGRSAAQLDDILGLLRLSTVWICGAIVIGLYLSLPRALRPGARVLLPSLPSLSPPPPFPRTRHRGGAQGRRLRASPFSAVAFRTTVQQTRWVQETRPAQGTHHPATRPPSSRSCGDS